MCVVICLRYLFRYIAAQGQEASARKCRGVCVDVYTNNKTPGVNKLVSKGLLYTVYILITFFIALEHTGFGLDSAITPSKCN